MKFLAILLIIQIVVLLLTKGHAVNWNNQNWALSCDFHGNDVSNANVPGDQCGGLCAKTSGCTHFTWTTYNGGTCWMKSGSASKADAFDTTDNSMVCGVLVDNSNGINWTGDWAFNCDWSGNDLSNAKVPGDQCGGLCAKTSGCTHFTWTTYNGGTCWMKSGSVSKSDAIKTSDNTMVCGVANGQNPGQPDPGNTFPFTFTNKCSYDIYVGAQGRSVSNPGWLPYNGGWKLSPGQSTNSNIPKDLEAARFWGRTGCSGSGNQFKCETGNCGPFLECGSGGTQRGGEVPATLAEFTLNGGPNKDQHSYDISLVDGYNVQMSIIVKNPNNKYGFSCKSPRCTSDLNRICPSELQQKNSAGKVVGCYSACAKFNTPQYCCAGAFNLPSTCKSSTWPVNYPSIFKQACPDAYSYAYDDASSLLFCSNTGYEIQFC